MSGPRQPGDSAGIAPATAGGDSANWPSRDFNGGGPGNSGSSGNNCGPFNNRVWTNHNQRHSPYPRQNYGNRDNSNNHNLKEKRQERDYTKRTDFQHRNPRYRGQHFRGHNHRNQPRRSEDNSSKSPYHYEESGEHQSRVPSDINKNKEPNCEPKSDASKAGELEDNQSGIIYQINQSGSQDKTTAQKEQSAEEPITDTNNSEKCFNSDKSEVNKIAGTSPNKEQLILSISSDEDSNQLYPRIQVRPLTQLLKQEILAVTQENRLGKGPLLSPSASVPPASPNRLAQKPNLRNRRRTVSNCIQNGSNPSTSQAGTEANINDRIASMDKESLKNIINNGDPIYDEHLKLQARRRLREEIRRQLKNIELEQPKDNLVTELVEDEIVDAIKLPELLLQEIGKCFGIDISEGQNTQNSEGNNQDTPNRKANEECLVPVENSEECRTESGSSSSVVKLEESEPPGRVLPSSENKTKSTIKDINQCIKVENLLIKEPVCAIESKNGNDKNKDSENVTTISKPLSEDDKRRKEVLQESNNKKSPKKNFKNSLNGKKIKFKKGKKKKPKAKTLQSGSQQEVAESFDSMKRSNDPNPRLKAADEIETLAGIRLNTNHSSLLPSSTCEIIPNSLETSSLTGDELKPSQSPTKTLKKIIVESANSEKEITSDITLPLNTHAKMEIKRESSSSPILVLPLVSKEVIDLLSSSDEEEEKMCVDNTDKQIALQADDQNLNVQERKPPTVDDLTSDHSNSSQCSSESTKRRRKLKLQNDAENVVDSFEKLILPHLREGLMERYRRQHSGNLQSRLHFISCVVTSAEYNSQTFSKIEVAKIQMNLKAADNRQAIEFLLREIVNVVNLQKQRRREQEEEQKLTSLLSPRKADSSSSPARQSAGALSTSPSISSRIGNQSSASRQSTPVESSHKSTQSSPNRNSSPSVDKCESPPGTSEVKRQNQEPFPVGLPFSAMDSRFSGGGLSRVGVGGADLSEPIAQLGDMMAQSLADIDRRLLENQNRRSILEEMIMKFQKEKSDLEILSLELQSRKFLLINSMISQNQASSTPVVNPRNSPPKASTSQESAQDEGFAKGGIAKRTRSRTKLRRAVLVKLVPKRQVRVQKRVRKKHKSDELIAQLRQEIADQEEKNKTSEEEAKESGSELKVQSNLKDEQQDEPMCETESAPTAKPTQSRLGKPKASVAGNQTHQPLAIIPPLPPPPPPPEPICHMSYDSEHWSELNSQEDFKLGFIPKGKLEQIQSPITQIKIYREYVIAAAEDGDIYMFHLVSHKLERKITKHSEAITNMYLSEKESLLYTTSLDGFFKKSSLENLERVIETVYFKEPLQSIDIAWGLAFIGSRWGLISTFNVVTNKVMDKPLASTCQSIIAIKATKEGVRKILLLGCKGNFVQMRDAANGLLLRNVCISEGLNVYSLLLNEGHIYCGTQRNEIFQLEFDTGNLVTKLKCGNGAVSIVSYKERYLLVGCYDGFIYVLDKITGTQVGRFEGAGRLVLALAVAGDKIVTSSKDNSLEILEVPAAMVNGY
ncbi:zinc finger protein 106 isoform X2 [Drosophila ficusphila]|uniref:zinc finger protein 106 isoform X2 n=1 Tax=Drosophila ficusphila TaxID=30025 RepID=UPI0007E66B50|nr:zinc finger protein 106 isoform X2 [Drosophila ficusphila]